MKAIELVKELLEYPDYDVMIVDTNGYGSLSINSIDEDKKIIWLEADYGDLRF